MALFAISDLHLPLGVNKPMDIFGKNWENYVERLETNWKQVVSEEDTVVMPGDFSWATYLNEAKADFDFLNSLPGRKIILKGNHDYWWTTMNKLKSVMNAKINTNELTILVDYEPSDTETEFEEEKAIARLTDIIESVEFHGFSITM